MLRKNCRCFQIKTSNYIKSNQNEHKNVKNKPRQMWNRKPTDGFKQLRARNVGVAGAVKVQVVVRLVVWRHHVHQRAHRLAQILRRGHPTAPSLGGAAIALEKYNLNTLPHLCLSSDADCVSSFSGFLQTTV